MDISNAYNKALELEGLLLILKSPTTDEAKISAVIDGIFDKIDEIDAEIVALRQQIKVEKSASTIGISVASEEVVENPVEENVNDIIDEVEDTMVDQVEAKIEEEVEELAIELENDLSVLADDDYSEPEIEVEFDCIDVQEPSDASQPEQNIDIKEELSEPSPAVSTEIVIDETGVDVNQSAFALKSRGDIRKMFTLNDNYKFRRELFANSQEQYTQALTDIESMESMTQAEDYFYNSLAWNKDNDEVKEFMSIVSVYFMGR